MNNKLRFSRGLAQIPLMIMLLLMAVAVPVATKLVQDSNMDNRNLAAEDITNDCNKKTGSTAKRACDALLKRQDLEKKRNAEADAPKDSGNGDDEGGDKCKGVHCGGKDTCVDGKCLGPDDKCKIKGNSNTCYGVGNDGDCICGVAGNANRILASGGPTVHMGKITYKYQRDTGAKLGEKCTPGIVGSIKFGCQGGVTLVCGYSGKWSNGKSTDELCNSNVPTLSQSQVAGIGVTDANGNPVVSNIYKEYLNCLGTPKTGDSFDKIMAICANVYLKPIEAPVAGAAIVDDGTCGKAGCQKGSVCSYGQCYDAGSTGLKCAVLAKSAATHCAGSGSNGDCECVDSNGKAACFDRSGNKYTSCNQINRTSNDCGGNLRNPNGTYANSKSAACDCAGGKFHETSKGSGKFTCGADNSGSNLGNRTPTGNTGGLGGGGGTCVNQCPVVGKPNKIVNCDGKDPDGATSLCNAVGRVEVCGGKNYCCPTVGGAWTTNMAKCPTVPGTCKECDKNFKCYKNGTEYKWFVTGYIMGGFSAYAETTSNPPKCGTIPKPAFLGKGKGDANCDGKIDVSDYSLWHKEFFDGNRGALVKQTWNADFTGTNGKCDRKVDVFDFSLWQKYFNQFN